MTLHFTTSRLVGALALTVGTLSTASAQTGTTTQGPTTGAAGASTTAGTPTGSTMTTPPMSGGAMGAATTTVQDSSARGTTRTRARRAAPGRRASGGASGGMAVTKDAAVTTPAPEPAPAPAPAPEPVPAPAPPPPPPAPVPEPAPVPAPAPEPVVTTTTTSTTTAIPRDPVGPNKFGNGLYFGLGGGANFPQNQLNNVYDLGPSANAQIGYDAKNGPLGVRLNLGFNRLNGTTLAATGTTRTELQNSNLFSALLDLKARLPFGRLFGATSGLYAVGGGGLMYFQDFQRFETVTGTEVGGPVGSQRLVQAGDATRFAANGGLGLDFGIGPASLFAEGRYVRVFTQGGNSNFIPVTLGIRFQTR